MTRHLAAVPDPAPDEEGAGLGRLLDHQLLAALGWDPEREVLAVPDGYPAVGYAACRRSGCRTARRRDKDLCQRCRGEHERSGLDLEAFVATRRPDQEEAWCAVRRCELPAASRVVGLCLSHRTEMLRAGQTREQFLSREDLRPRISLGACQVVPCDRPAAARLTRLCMTHQQRWRTHKKQDPGAELDEWVSREDPVYAGPGLLVLRGLPERVRQELLYGIQRLHGQHAAIDFARVRSVAESARAHQVTSILDIDSEPPGRKADAYLLVLQTEVRRATGPPRDEVAKGKWRLALWGHGGNLDFTGIRQPALREATKDWAWEEIPRHRDSVATQMRALVASVVRLSESLWFNREDHGLRVEDWGRQDVVHWLAYLGHLVADGRMSPSLRASTIANARRVLSDMREAGLTGPGRPLEGLPHDFVVRGTDVPKKTRGEQAPRSLPPGLVALLEGQLDLLAAQAGPEAAAAVELIMVTGRRPDEICRLPWDCLEVGRDGKFTLVYTDYKNLRLARLLPVDEATAALVRAQQQRARQRFPDTPVGELKLFPEVKKLVGGRRGRNARVLGQIHRAWVDSLEDVRARDGGGEAVEVDRSRISLYAYRHSYCQRLADIKTPPDLMQELMGHDDPSSTQVYYKHSSEALREAVDRVSAQQLDARGGRVWDKVQQLLDNELARHALGSTSVPFGRCTEPANVQAGGGACPFRMRCLGCAHFRTDPSYLPELRAHLDQLLVDQARLRAATELEDWARERAMPSQAEVDRARQLVRQLEEHLDRLPEEDRTLIRQAADMVRAARRVVPLGMPAFPPAPGLASERPV